MTEELPRPLAVLGRLPDARQRRRGRGHGPGGVAAPAHAPPTVETPKAVPHHGRHAARDRHPALGPRAPRDLRRPVAAGAAGRGRRRPRRASRTTSRSRSRSWCCSSASTPVERAVFVLRESSTTSYAEIAEIVGKQRGQLPPDPQPRRAGRSTTSGRASSRRPRERDALAARFLAPPATATCDGLVAMLAADAVIVGDGGGKAARAAAPAARRRPTSPAALLGVLPPGRAAAGVHVRAGARQRPARLPHRRPRRRAGQRRGGRDRGRRRRRVHSVLNPDKLGHLGPLSDLGLRPVRPTPPR